MRGSVVLMRTHVDPRALDHQDESNIGGARSGGRRVHDTRCERSIATQERQSLSGHLDERRLLGRLLTNAVDLVVHMALGEQANDRSAQATLKVCHGS